VSDGRPEDAKGGRGLRRPSQLAQIVGSILVALVIAAIAIAVVTAHFGSTPVAELEAREERIDAREDAREDREKAREDAREEREEARP
jgi:hypothetical protein